MKINYPITDDLKRILRKYAWLTKNFQVGEVGTWDDREVVRLLLNPHYSGILSILELIEEYGPVCGAIIDRILQCNDYMSFPRYLSELYLFAYLLKIANKENISVPSDDHTSNPDISLKLDDLDVLIEIYSPTDFYGYQDYERALIRAIKYLDVPFGFVIQIDEKSADLFYTYKFPDFRTIDKWLDTIINSVQEWLLSADEGDSKNIVEPNSKLSIDFNLKEKNADPAYRIVSRGGATKSTDTRIYFERMWDGIDDSQWGIKILDKLKKQQAGSAQEDKLRILMINFSMAETSDLSFLNQEKYFANIKGLICRLSKQVEPFPPYDVVIPCILGLECGFANPINLTSQSDDEIQAIVAKCGMNRPIPEVPIAAEEETKALINEILDLDDTD